MIVRPRAGFVGKKINSAGRARLQHVLFKRVGLGVLGGGGINVFVAGFGIACV